MEKLKLYWLEIFFGLIVIVIICAIIKTDEPFSWGGDELRNLIFLFGGLGAFYGLILSARRLEKFSKQVETSERNLFNDRLSRAIEALGHKKIAVRNSGLRLLHNLGNEAPQNSDNRQIIVNILHGYIRARAMMPKKSDNGELPAPEPSEKRADITLGITLLFDLVPPDMRENFPLDNLDLRSLHFEIIQDFQKTNLMNTNLQSSRLLSANLRDAYLINSNLKNADMEGVILERTYMAGANLENAYLRGAELESAQMGNVNLEGADVGSADFYCVEGLTQEIFGKSVYQHRYNLPKNLPEGLILLPKRAYEWAKNENGQMCRRFVNNKEWIDEETPWWQKDLV